MVCFETMVILKLAEDFSVNVWLEKGVPFICPFKKTLLLTTKNKQIYLEANNVETKSTLISIFFELSEGSTSMLSLYKEMKIDIKLFFLRFICIGTYKQNRTLFTLTLWVLYESLTNFVSLISFCNSESIKKPLIF